MEREKERRREGEKGRKGGKERERKREREKEKRGRARARATERWLSMVGKMMRRSGTENLPVVKLHRPHRQLKRLPTFGQVCKHPIHSTMGHVVAECVI